MNRISESFVRIDEDGLALYISVSEPNRLRKIRINDRKPRDFPTCFAPRPASLEISHQQVSIRQIALELGVVRMEEPQALIDLSRLPESVILTKPDRLVAKRVDVVRLQLEGLVKPFQRLFASTEPKQGVANVVAMEGMCRIEFVHLHVVGKALLEQLQGP